MCSQPKENRFNNHEQSSCLSLKEIKLNWVPFSAFALVRVSHTQYGLLLHLFYTVLLVWFFVWFLDECLYLGLGSKLHKGRSPFSPIEPAHYLHLINTCWVSEWVNEWEWIEENSGTLHKKSIIVVISERKKSYFQFTILFPSYC
jgi:hypothetical protein